MAATRRNAISPVDLRIVLSIAAVSGVVAAFAGTAPTGSTPVDVVLAALVAGVVTWIGASVPWWALIVAAGGAGLVAAAGGSVVLTAVSWSALAAAMWISATRSNRAPVRALIAAVVVQVAFRFGWDPFFLASALAAAALIALIVVTGVRRRPRHVRRPVYLTAAGVAVLSVAATAAFGISFLRVRDAAANGYGLMLDGLEFVQDGQIERGAQVLRNAATGLGTASDGVGSPLSQPARLVPGVAQNRNAVADLLDQASAAAAAAADTLDRVDIDQLRVVDGRIDLAAFDTLVGPLTELERTVADMGQVLDKHRSEWLVGPLQQRFRTTEDRVVQIERQTTGVAMLARVGPGLLGGDGPRRYFLAFVNSAEARSTGGLMGNWAEITIDGGRISKTAGGRTVELQRAIRDGHVVLDLSDEFFDRYGRWDLGGNGEPARWNSLVNVTLTPDGPTVGAGYAQLYEGATGRSVDGAFVIDPRGMAALLAVAGPVELESIGVTLDARNAERFLLIDQYEYVEADREDFLEEVTERAVDQVLSTTLPPPHELARTLADPALEGHITGTAVRASEQELFTFVGMDGALPHRGVDTWSDVLAVTVNNASGNKIDTFLRREVHYDVDHDPDTGAARATLRVTLHNTAPTSGFDDYVIGNLVGLPAGYHQVLVDVFSALEVTSARVDGVEFDVETGIELGLNTTRFFLLQIPPGDRVEIEMELGGGVASGWYELIYRPQSLPNPENLTIDGRSGARTISHTGPVVRRSVFDALGRSAWR